MAASCSLLSFWHADKATRTPPPPPPLSAQQSCSQLPMPLATEMHGGFALATVMDHCTAQADLEPALRGHSMSNRSES